MSVTDNTVSGYCAYLGWSVAELSRQAGIDYKSATKAHNKERISGGTKRSIASAFSAAMGQQIQVGDIQWQQ